MNSSIADFNNRILNLIYVYYIINALYFLNFSVEKIFIATGNELLFVNIHRPKITFN